MVFTTHLWWFNGWFIDLFKSRAVFTADMFALDHCAFDFQRFLSLQRHTRSWPEETSLKHGKCIWWNLVVISNPPIYRFDDVWFFVPFCFCLMNMQMQTFKFNHIYRILWNAYSVPCRSRSSIQPQVELSHCTNPFFPHFSRSLGKAPVRRGPNFGEGIDRAAHFSGLPKATDSSSRTEGPWVQMAAGDTGTW